MKSTMKKLPLIAAVFTAFMAQAQLATKKALTLEAATGVIETRLRNSANRISQGPSGSRRARGLPDQSSVNIAPS